MSDISKTSTSAARRRPSWFGRAAEPGDPPWLATAYERSCDCVRGELHREFISVDNASMRVTGDDVKAPDHRLRGERYARGATLVAQGTRITPGVQALLIAAGLLTVPVYKRPRVGVVLSSHDAVPPADVEHAWQRPDSMSAYVRSLFARWGYVTPSDEQLAPLRPMNSPSATQEARRAYIKRLFDLTSRYDLLIGVGMPADISLCIKAGGDPSVIPLGPGECTYFPAGLPLPENADAILYAPPEETDEVTVPIDSTLKVTAPVRKGDNARSAGEDYERGATLVARGTRITPQMQAVLIAAGVFTVPVYRPPRVGVVLSSYDTVPPANVEHAWQRPDSMSAYVRSLLAGWGYAAPTVEQLAPLPPTDSPSAAHDALDAYRDQLLDLMSRYDLLIGVGMPADGAMLGNGLRAQRSGRHTRGCHRYALVRPPPPRFDGICRTAGACLEKGYIGVPDHAARSRTSLSLGCGEHR